MLAFARQKKIDLTSAAAETKPLPEQEKFEEIEPGTNDLNAMVSKYEKLLILTTLNQHQWHRQKTAEALNVDRKTLFNKMRRYDLTS